MRNFAITSTAILGAMLALSLPATPAQAQLNRSWVASYGSGSNCIRATPCASFQAAHDDTNAGGEINCVDAGNYGPVTITKAISIVCDNTQAGIGVSGFADGVDITAGANDVITLKGLDIEGLGSAFAGINFQSGAALHVHKVHVRNFRNSGSSSGLIFQPATYAELYVADSTFSDNGTTAIGGGILIAPVGSGSVNVSINRVRLENNFSGILVDGTHTTGVAVNATVLDSGIAGSQSHGFLAQIDGRACGGLSFL